MVVKPSRSLGSKTAPDGLNLLAFQIDSIYLDSSRYFPSLPSS